MYKERLPLYKALEKKRNSRLITYITGDRQGMETQMAPDVLDRFVDHLDLIKTNKITLFLHSRGGDTGVGWSIANLIRSFCDEFEIIVPLRAHSAATLLCLGADRIVMTKQASLGPFDPSVNTPLNPAIPGAPPQAPKIGVSVESIKGYIQLATDELKIKNSTDKTQVLSLLSNSIHPLVLGSVFRARAHIRMLATNLIKKQLKHTNPKNEKKIVSFLCGDSGSHDYTINRKEARDTLGLNIEKPDDDLYAIIRDIYKDIESELELRVPYNPVILAADSDKVSYSCRRALIESCTNGTDVFISEGILIKQQIQTPNGIIPSIQDSRTFEGWRKENA
jgi:hypothetical protein